MTIHIQMLQDIATHARAMADSMQAIVDDCAERLARRKAAGESEESNMNEPLEFDPLYDIHHVRMTIVQPRLNNLSSYEMETNELLRWAETEVRPKAMLAYEGQGEFCAGEWCRFCKARYTCRKRSEYQSHHRQGSRVLRSRFRAPEHQRQRTQVQLLPHHSQERYRDGRKDQGSH